MEISEIKKIIEALLFVSDKPLITREIKAIVKDELSENDKVEDILQQMQQEYTELNRAYELKFVADGWTFATKPEYSLWIKKLLKEKTILKLSPSAMEVLAIIAYKQPITRAEIDNIRGVDSGGVIDTLLDRKFVKIVGRKESLGRPLLYGTTQDFLRHFGLSHLSELPVIENVNDAVQEPKEQTQELPFEENININEQNNNADNNISGIKEDEIEQKTENERDVPNSEIQNNEPAAESVNEENPPAQAEERQETQNENQNDNNNNIEIISNGIKES